MSILQFPHNISVDKIKKFVDRISYLSEIIQQKPVSHLQKQSIFHHQILKSSLFSAQIEGNNLTLIEAENIDFSSPKQKSELEISNVLKSLKNITKLPKKI